MCVVSVLFAWFLFCVRGSFFVCVVSFLFACFLFLFAWFLFCLRVFFFVCVFSFLFAACPLWAIVAFSYLDQLVNEIYFAPFQWVNLSMYIVKIYFRGRYT